MKKQNPQRTCKQPEHSCKVIKKHSCSEHTSNRSDTHESPKGGKSGKSIPQNFCPCNPCSCDDCPDVLQLLTRPISNKGMGNKSKGFEALEDLSFGLCPKSANAKSASCSKTCTEVVMPKPIKLDMITYDDECTCELIARAIRTDVHRYLSMVDRTPKPNPNSDFKACPECMTESIPKSNPKSKIKFSDTDIDRNLSPCLQPDAEL